MRWKKLGLIFKTDRNYSWMVSHSAIPFAQRLAGDRYRVYFSARDEKNRSHTAYIEIDLKEPANVLDISSVPALTPGELGAFDDSGAMPSWVTDTGDGKKRLYYTGWSLGVSVPFYFYIGMAESRDGGRTFEKCSPSPILERTPVDPYLTASPCVVREGNKWRMWYVSCVGWKVVDRAPRHYYHIKYAESADGRSWQRNGIVCIDFKSPDEYAIARPCVINEDGIYKMWYAYRGEKYRLGYAESPDGISWTRMDADPGIDVSPSGWDSEMVAYAFVFLHDGDLYMLYNGNGYGKSGIGLAVAGR